MTPVYIEYAWTNPHLSFIIEFMTSSLYTLRKEVEYSESLKNIYKFYTEGAEMQCKT